MKTKILAIAQQVGSQNALAPIVKELADQGYQVTNYATDDKAASFSGQTNYTEIVREHDLVLVGLSGSMTADVRFTQAANYEGITSVGVLDQDSNYFYRLGDSVDNIPTVISIMDKGCLKGMRRQLSKEVGEEAINRSQVVGWTAYDHFQDLKAGFTEDKKAALRAQLGVDPNERVHVYFSQNIPPDAVYWQNFDDLEEGFADEYFTYEMQLTEETLRASSKLGLRLRVKPHPREEGKHTQGLTERFGSIYLPATACDSKELILTADSVLGGRTGCILDSCLFDRNTGALFPDVDPEKLVPYPPVTHGAIPYAKTWSDIPELIQLVSLPDEKTNKELAENRKRFSTDGKASPRLVKIIAELLD